MVRNELPARGDPCTCSEFTGWWHRTMKFNYARGGGGTDLAAWRSWFAITACSRLLRPLCEALVRGTLKEPGSKSNFKMKKGIATFISHFDRKEKEF